jgi:hypothetical protein
VRTAAYRPIIAFLSSQTLSTPVVAQSTARTSSSLQDSSTGQRREVQERWARRFPATFAKTVDLSAFGTRHSSVLRYCPSDPDAIGVIISQDGHVRIAMSSRGSVLLWDRIKLLKHRNFSRETAEYFREHNISCRIASKVSGKLGQRLSRSARGVATPQR